MYMYWCRALNLSLYTSTALGGEFLLDVQSCFCAHIIVKYCVLVLLQELVEECDNLDKTALFRLTDYWDRLRKDYQP